MSHLPNARVLMSNGVHEVRVVFSAFRDHWTHHGWSLVEQEDSSPAPADSATPSASVHGSEDDVTASADSEQSQTEEA